MTKASIATKIKESTYSFHGESLLLFDKEAAVIEGGPGEVVPCVFADCLVNRRQGSRLHFSGIICNSIVHFMFSNSACHFFHFFVIEKPSILPSSTNHSHLCFCIGGAVLGEFGRSGFVQAVTVRGAFNVVHLA